MADKPVCKIDSCDKAADRRGWCAAHYYRWRVHGDPEGGEPIRVKNGGQCKAPGCDLISVKGGFCSDHYERNRVHGDPLGGRTRRGARMDFINSVVEATGQDECIFWPYSRNADGYGQMHIKGKSTLAHRVVATMKFGPPKLPSHQCAHLCGNGHLGCVNPRHLVWATVKENIGHKKRHGTHLLGEDVGTSKLTEADVREIRGFAEVSPRSELAAKFKVSQSTIDRVLNGDCWGHVE